MVTMFSSTWTPNKEYLNRRGSAEVLLLLSGKPEPRYASSHGRHERHIVDTYADTPDQREAKRRFLESPTAQWASQEDYERAYQSYLSEGGTPVSHPAGVIPGSTPDQREAKRRFLESPTAQWASQEDYERAYQSYLSEGGTPVSHPAGVIPGSTREERKAEAATYDARQAAPQVHQQGSMLKNSFTGEMLYDSRPDPYAGVQGIPGAEWLTMTRKGMTPQVIPGEGYGWRYPEPSQQEKVLKGTIPVGVGMSDFSSNIYKQAQNIANTVRNVDIRSSSFPVPVISTAVPFVKESIARTIEFLGIIPGTVEIVGKTAITKPSALPMMAIVGGLSVVGGIAKQAETEPAQLISDVVVTAGIFHGLGKVRTKVTEGIKFTGKEFVPPKTIIDPQAFRGVNYPVMPKGATPMDLVAEFKKGEFRLPGTEGKIGGWHATPSEWAKETVTTPGSSELPGTYIAPATVPHYWQINRGYKMFGWDAPPETPTGIWMELADIRRSPPATRYSQVAQARFLKEQAAKDVGYISSTFEKGIKREKEAIIPPEAIAKRVRFEQYTEWEGKKVPLMEYTVKQPKGEPPESYPFDFTGGEHGISVTRGPKGMRIVAVGDGIAAGVKPSKAQKESELPFREFERQQRMISRQYREYKTPVFTPESVVTSLSRSASRSLRSGTPSSVRSSIVSSQKAISRSVSQELSRQISSAQSNIRSGISSRITPGIPSRGVDISRVIRVPKGAYPSMPSAGAYPAGGGGMPRDQFKFPKLPKFDNMGDVRPRRGRRSSSYEIRNPFSELRDLIRGL